MRAMAILAMQGTGRVPVATFYDELNQLLNKT